MTKWEIDVRTWQLWRIQPQGGERSWIPKCLHRVCMISLLQPLEIYTSAPFWVQVWTKSVHVGCWNRGCLRPTCRYEDDSNLGALLGFRWFGIPSEALHHGCRISQKQLHFVCEEWTPRLSQWRKLRGKEEGLYLRSRRSSSPGECERMVAADAKTPWIWHLF